MKVVPRITRPCSQDWAGMVGDEKKRFCEECQLQVHNLPAMSEEEQRALLSRRERRCVAYVTDDRTIRDSSGTWLLLQRMGWRRGLAFLAVAVSLWSVGCATTQSAACVKPTAGPKTEDAKQVRETEDGKMMVGVVEEERPLWRKILFFWEW